MQTNHAEPHPPRPRDSRWKWAASLFIIGVVAVLASMLVSNTGDNLVLVENSVRSQSDGVRLWTGVLHNRSDGPLAPVHAQVSLLDKEGDIVGNFLLNTQSLGAGQTWTIQVPLVKEAVHFRLEKLHWTDEERDFIVGPYRIQEITTK